MALDIYWTDEDAIWSETEALWSGAVEIVVVTNRGVAFVDIRRKIDKYKKFVPKKKEEPQYIKLICVVNDEKFEQKNYINKKLKIGLTNETFTIIEAKKSNVSIDDIKWKLENLNINEIKLNINNVKKS